MEPSVLPPKIQTTQSITCGYHSSHISCYGTAQGTIYVSNKGKMDEISFSTFPIDRIQIIERWEIILALCGSRLLSFNLKNNLKREEIIANETSVLCFAVDEQGDRLAIGSKRKLLLYKRVNLPNNLGTRYEQLHLIDLEGETVLDLCLIIENGQRWLCISTVESLFWVNADRGTKNRPTLPPADFLTQGRRQDEVLICRGQSCTFSTPFHERSNNMIIKFSSICWQVVLCRPFIVGCLKNSIIEIRLEDGQLMQTIENIPVSFRWTVSTGGRQSIYFIGGGKSYQAFQVILPISKQVNQLLKEKKYSLAMSLARTLTETIWRLEDDNEKGEEEDRGEIGLYERCKFEYSCSILQTRPACTTEQVMEVAKLLQDTFPQHSIFTELDLFHFFYMFSDSDLFINVQQANDELHQLFHQNNNNKSLLPPPAYFKSGVFSLAIREIVLPVILHIRETTQRLTQQLDSLVLRCFVLGRPGKNMSTLSQKFEMEKKKFLGDNLCSITESERLLLSFPEMWEDHAALLAGKGEFEKGLEWLKVLGTSNSTNIENYAQAAIRMLSERKDLVLTHSEWILKKAPLLGIDAIVKFHCFSGSDMLINAKKYFNNSDLFKQYLERLCREELDENCPDEARDALALIYLDENEQEKFLKLVSNPKSHFTNSQILLVRLDNWPREQAMILDKLNRCKEAAFILATKCTMEIAEEYARKCTKENVFDVVFDGLLTKTEGKKTGEEEALSFLTRNFDKLNGTRALAQLSENRTLHSCLDLVHVALTAKAAAHRDHLIVSQLLKRESLAAMEKLAKENANYVVIDSEFPICSICQRHFKADNPIIVLNGEVFHYICYQSQSNSSGYFNNNNGTS